MRPAAKRVASVFEEIENVLDGIQQLRHCPNLLVERDLLSTLVVCLVCNLQN